MIITPFDITALFNSTKAALDIIKGIKNISDKVHLNSKLSELYNVITSLQNDLLIMQANHSELLKVKEQIERELLEYKNWEEEKRNYKLTEISSNIFVYSYEPQSIQSVKEPPHWLCTNCYNDNKKSIIQLKSHLNSCDTYFCKKCEFEFTIDNPDYKPSSSKPKHWLTK